MFWAVKSSDSFTYKAAPSLLSLSVSQSLIELMSAKPPPCASHSALFWENRNGGLSLSAGEENGNRCDASALHKKEDVKPRTWVSHFGKTRRDLQREDISARS